jgi:hypothetical protein
VQSAGGFSRVDLEFLLVQVFCLRGLTLFPGSKKPSSRKLPDEGPKSNQPVRR